MYDPSGDSPRCWRRRCASARPARSRAAAPTAATTPLQHTHMHSRGHVCSCAGAGCLCVLLYLCSSTRRGEAATGGGRGSGGAGGCRQTLTLQARRAAGSVQERGAARVPSATTHTRTSLRVYTHTCTATRTAHFPSLLLFLNKEPSLYVLENTQWFSIEIFIITYSILDM